MKQKTSVRNERESVRKMYNDILIPSDIKSISMTSNIIFPAFIRELMKPSNRGVSGCNK